MPIYAYKCESCGHVKDVLQKISDQPLTDCPSCGAATFKKQLTAAGFQLKGSGWYVTDFRNGGSGASASSPTHPTEAASTAGAAGNESTAVSNSAVTTSESAAPATAASCGTSCACH